jgi:hypothetical protein
MRMRRGVGSRRLLAALLVVLCAGIAASAYATTLERKATKTTVTFDEMKFPPQGVVTSADKDCVKGRKVTVYVHTGDGSTLNEGSDQADNRGRWRVAMEPGSLPSNSNGLYATVSAISGGGHDGFNCAADKSNVLHIGR